MKTYIQYNKEFDEKFRYDEKDLGATCTAEGTSFKLWSPLADGVLLHIYESETSDKCTSIAMTGTDKGIWSWESKESLHGVYYDYTIIRGQEETQTADPYALSCACDGFRSMVVDLSKTDPDGFAQDKAPAKEAETIIYELHVKDFSYDEHSGVPAELRGKFKAFTIDKTQTGYPTCVEYLKQLGVTHVHLLPMYDYASVKEDGATDQFNWGYDPLNYNVPEGSYATDPHDGVVRIRECKEMIQALHKNGIRVVMDVVYNHTFTPDSFLERTVPGYYNRRLEDGSLANGSACGSDVACGRAMVDNYIADSVMYWAKEYHFDGFRFDLMGLLTTELMNRIRKELDEEFGAGEKLLYGEPWRADVSPMEEGTHAALKDNIAFLDEEIAIFSDDTRDVIKGHVFEAKELGFVNGAKGLEERVLGAVTGWCAQDINPFHPKRASQIIQYVSAHDNFTLWDKLVLTMKEGIEIGSPEFAQKDQQILDANKLCAFIYFTCQGHIFIHAGEEFGRTKLGDENSYASSAEVNMLRWEQTQEFSELLAYYKGLIRLRKKLWGLCDKSKEAAARISDKKVWEEGVVSFRVDNTDPRAATDDWKELLIAYNANDRKVSIELPKGAWSVLADKTEADCVKEVPYTEDGRCRIAAGSGILLARK